MNGEDSETISSISQKLNTAEFFTIQHNHKTVTELLYNYYKFIQLQDSAHKSQREGYTVL
jgi:hypothetical protein